MHASWILGALLALLTPAAAGSSSADHQGSISGVVRHSKTKERIANALVVIQCACLQGARETQTNAQGIYRFSGLPAGVYTIQVLAGRADVSKVIELPPTPPSGS